MAKMTPTPSKEVESNTADSTTLNQILERMDILESENAELKKNANPENAFTKWKKRYEWPRHYSFKLWGGKPVLNYVSEKQDPTRDLVFKNQFGEYTENQLMNLTLLAKDGKTENMKVLVTTFNDWFERSEKMPAEVKSDGVNTISYTFKTKEFWEFTVDPRIIN